MATVDRELIALKLKFCKARLQALSIQVAATSSYLAKSTIPDEMKTYHDELFNFRQQTSAVHHEILTLWEALKDSEAISKAKSSSRIASASTPPPPDNESESDAFEHIPDPSAKKRRTRHRKQ